MAKGMPSRNSFYALDCEGFAPNVFFSSSSSFSKSFSSNLVQTFNSSVDVVTRTFTPAPLWGDFPVQENTLILLGCSLTSGIHEREGCAHAIDMCVCTRVCTSGRCLKCTLHFSLNVQNFQKPEEEEGKKKNKTL